MLAYRSKKKVQQFPSPFGHVLRVVRRPFFANFPCMLIAEWEFYFTLWLMPDERLALPPTSNHSY
jgi:hypothetical protein